jgi:mRNA interferase MazF
LGRARRPGGWRAALERRAAKLNRGDIFDVDWPGLGEHPAVVLTRQAAIPALSAITVALITSTVRDLPTEVPVGRAHGLDHDNVVTVSKDAFRRYRGHLGPEELFRLRRALMVALGLDSVV